MDTSVGILSTAVLGFATSVAKLPESDLNSDWPSPSAPGALWHGYDDTVRDMVFRVYHELCDLTVTAELQRLSPPSEAQRILAQHHDAYRDLTGALVGVDEDEFDRAPAENEWPLRTVLYHIALAERGFHALIHWAVARRRDDDSVSIEMPEDYRDSVSDPVEENGAMADVLRRFDTLHARVLADFANLDSADLDAPNVWWEGYEISVRFRLHRFNAHAREHTIQVDKTLHGIGHRRTEPEQLARLFHRALGRFESLEIGSTPVLIDQQHTFASELDAARRTFTLLRN